MGFAGFDSTKGKGVEDNKKGPAKGATSKHKEREYRQYMNRRGTSTHDGRVAVYLDSLKCCRRQCT